MASPTAVVVAAVRAVAASLEWAEPEASEETRPASAPVAEAEVQAAVVVLHLAQPRTLQAP